MPFSAPRFSRTADDGTIRGSSSRRFQSGSSSSVPQLYRPTTSSLSKIEEQINHFLSRRQHNQKHMSDEEIMNFFLSTLSSIDNDEKLKDSKMNLSSSSIPPTVTSKAESSLSTTATTSTTEWNENENILLRKMYHRRIREIRKWTADLDVGKARIDVDGRLVPVTVPPQPPRANLPPPIPPPMGGNGNGNNNNNNNNDNNNGHPLFGNNNNHLEQEEERWLAREHREAAAIIDHAVQVYREEGVLENDFELIVLDPMGHPVDATTTAAAAGTTGTANNNNGNRPDGRRGGGRGRGVGVNAGVAGLPALRRILLGTVAFLTAFACVVLRTLPHLSTRMTMITTTNELLFDPNFDKLLYELVNVRSLYEHHHNHPKCVGLNRSPPSPKQSTGSESTNAIFSAVIRWLKYWHSAEYDCSDQVLHIPPRHILSKEFELSTSMEEAQLRIPYSDGVDVSWSLPCIIPPRRNRHNDNDRCIDVGRKDDIHHAVEENECNMVVDGTDGDPPRPTEPHMHMHNNNDVPTEKEELCFRGVHDNLIIGVGDILRLGATLIAQGGDHFDVHYDVSYLQTYIPKTVQTLKNLLQDRYLGHQRRDKREKHTSSASSTVLQQRRTAVEPVAFRILTTGPMDGYGVNLYRSPASTLNSTNYLQWIERSKEHNEMAHYSLPIWPFRVPAKRDACHLMYDLHVNETFAIRTAVFLTDGSYMNFRGGANLFVDYHPSNTNNPKRKIQRGITVDASQGRVIVSTGGLENLQCRLPTRAGLRSVLQIWWDYV